MISNVVIIGFCFGLLVSVFLPIIMAIVLRRKYKYKISSLFIGAGVFIVFQLITRLPLLSFLEQSISLSTIMPLTVYLLFMAFTAGLFEEGGRFLAFNFILKKRRDFGNTFAFGLGHGGIEAMVLVGMTMINNITMAFMINSGTFEATYSTVLPASQVAAIKAQMLAVTPFMSFAGGIERVFTLAIQIALTFLIVTGFKKGKKFLYLIYAILAHTLVDFITIFASIQLGLNPIVIEIILGVMAVGAVWYIIYCRKNEFSENGEESITVE